MISLCVWGWGSRDLTSLRFSLSNFLTEVKWHNSWKLHFHLVPLLLTSADLRKCIVPLDPNAWFGFTVRFCLLAFDPCSILSCCSFIPLSGSHTRSHSLNRFPLQTPCQVHYCLFVIHKQQTQPGNRTRLSGM